MCVCVCCGPASRWPVPPEDVIKRTTVQEPVSATAALFISRGDKTREQNTPEGQSKDVVYITGEER